MESKFLKDALFGGMTANGFKLGTVLSFGWFWTRVGGCCLLYRGESFDGIDCADILAVGEPEASEISPPSWVSHTAGRTYFYLVRRVNGCGQEEQSFGAVVRVRIDTEGELAKARPNAIFTIRARRVDGDRIELTWFYNPLGQESEPVCFSVYYDGGTGEIDYDNAVGVIDYAGRRYYSYTSGSLAAGEYAFAVRAEDSAGIQSCCLGQIRVQLKTTVPDAVDIVGAEAI